MEITFDRFGPIVIATPHSDRLDATNAEEFGEALAQHIRERPGIPLLINLHEILYMSSAGLTKIIAAKQLLAEHKGHVRVGGVREDVLRVFEVTGLASTFGCDAPWQFHVREAAEHFIADIDDV